MSDQTPRTEALLLQGLEACFSTAQGNAQTPRSIFDFLRISYLPAIEAEARATDSLCMVQYAKGRADERKRIADAVRALNGRSGAPRAGSIDWVDRAAVLAIVEGGMTEHDALREAAERVRTLDFRYVDMDGDGTEPVVSQAAVLAILTEEKP